MDVSSGYKFNPDEDYTTPDVYRQRAEYAKALMAASKKPVTHWAGGVANMIDALRGGQEMKKAQRDLASSDKNYATAMADGALNSSGPGNVSNPMGRASSGSGYAPPFPGAPARSDSSTEQSPALAEDRSQYFAELNDPQVRHTLFQRAANEDETDPSAFIQSAINRAAAEGKSVLQTINNPKFYPATSFKNKAYDKEAYDKALAAVQFGDNKLGYGTDNASENVGFGYGRGARDPRTYTSAGGERYGVQNTPASKAYAASRASLDDAGPQVSQDQMVDRALALSGPDAPQRVAQALTRGTKAAPAPGQTPYPNPTTGQQFIDPSLVPQQRAPTREQMINILRHRGGNDSQNDQMFDRYQQHGQPRRIDMGEYGTVIVSPDGRVQQLIPKLHENTSDLRGFKEGGFDQIVPGLDGRPLMRKVPREDAGTRPVQTAPDEPPPPLPKSNKRSDAIPSMLNQGSLPPQEAQAALPPQDVIAEIADKAVAGLGDEDTTPEKIDVAALGNGNISDAPPPGAQRLAGPAPAPAAPVQVAQASGLPPGVSPDNARTMQWLDDQDVTKKGNEALATKDAETLVKSVEETQVHAQTANQLISQLGLMRNLIEDPKFIHGSLADQRVAFQNFMATLKLSPDFPVANQAFEKLRSEAVLTNMKAKLGGLGQVRLAEISLLNQAMASSSNSTEANRAILVLNMRAAEQLNTLATVADGVMKGYRVGPAGQWMTDAKGQPRVFNKITNTDLRTSQNNWLRNNPMVSKDEMTEYTQLFKDNRTDKPAETASAKKPGREKGWLAVPPPETPTPSPNQKPLP